MTFRPIKALYVFFLLALIALPACQANLELPSPTRAPTGAAQTLTVTRAPSATPQPTATLTPTITPTPLSLKGVQVVFWHPWQGELEKQAEGAVAEFNRKNSWGIRASLRSFYSTAALEEALQTAWQHNAGSGTVGQTRLPAVVAAPPELLAEWAGAGRVADLNHFMSDPHYGFQANEAQFFYPLFWRQDQSGQRQNGIPALRTARVLFYNQSWAKELGFETPPTTPDDLYRQACAAAIENNRSPLLERRGTGGYLLDTDALTTLSWMGAFDATIVPARNDLPYTFKSPEASAALAYLRKLLDDGCAWVPRSAAPLDFFADRKALFYAGPLTDLSAQQHMMARQQNDDQWTILPFPGQDGQPLVYSGGYSYGLLSGEPQAQMAGWLLARWLAGPDQAARMVEALPSLPVSDAVAERLSGKSSFPFDRILPLQPGVRAAPALPTWRAVRRLLEDAAHQAYYLPSDQIGLVLPVLEEMTGEILKRTPAPAP